MYLDLTDVQSSPLTCLCYSCGNYMAMIFGDYVAGFLGLQRDGITGNMTPFDVSLYLFEFSMSLR